jgi:hypothetical protein
VASTNPAIVMDEDNITFGKNLGDNFNPVKPYVALSGRVPVKISAENGPVVPGDLLTSSSIPGIAMKATAKGPIVGKALEPYNGSGVDKIEMFVNVSWYDPGMLVDSGGNVAQVNPDGSTTKISAQTVEASEGLFEKLTATVLATFKKLIAETAEIVSAFVENLTVDKLTVTDKTSGQAVVSADNYQLTINNSQVTETSKVFVTFRDSYAPATQYWVSDVQESEGFTVTLDQPVSADSRFDYWIVN